jgi:predicted amidophosphoribosyltransferase
MVSKCIKCGKMLKGFGLYCDNCENKIKGKIEKEEAFKEKYNKSDFFERQRMK